MIVPPTTTTSPISSVTELGRFISSIPPSSTLYLDLEGYKLGRSGNIAIITVPFIHKWWLGSSTSRHSNNTAFISEAHNGKSLKSILEDRETPKCLWDVRNDADALWALYQVRLAGVTDVQLLENASRAGDKTYVHGLDKCIQSDLKLGFMALNRWIRTKQEIRTSMPTGIFNTRPLDSKTVQYCINDVVYLPDLYASYMKRIESDWLAKAMDESERRVVEALSAGSEP